MLLRDGICCGRQHAERPLARLRSPSIQDTRRHKASLLVLTLVSVGSSALSLPVAQSHPMRCHRFMRGEAGTRSRELSLVSVEARLSGGAALVCTVLPIPHAVPPETKPVIKCQHCFAGNDVEVCHLGAYHLRGPRKSTRVRRREVRESLVIGPGKIVQLVKHRPQPTARRLRFRRQCAQVFTATPSRPYKKRKLKQRQALARPSLNSRQHATTLSGQGHRTPTTASTHPTRSVRSGWA